MFGSSQVATGWAVAVGGSGLDVCDCPTMPEPRVWDKMKGWYAPTPGFICLPTTPG
ncbi:hypothetical protein GCM10007392_25810 [Saccharospirillum salsuginis]|uniref:Uncharacterized protein n=1 Tax=Saccharospirillum salsuginis TaxID=418750 RepID=A0A918KB31_9GAMM|nr:hypothetical protein GCM10007392_25810 [Saccharospirillum salsuginis]